MHQSEVPKIQQESILTRIEYEYVQCGYEHNCALRTDNRVTCWGSSLDQQLNIPLREKATATIEGGEMSTMQIYGCCSDCSVSPHAAQGMLA
jgi:alpha-tubulin suppressor-like RCC1 family protein